MGLFDEIRCEVDLPDGGRTSDVYFQTKTFPSPCMHRFLITRTGWLVDSAGNDLEPDGYIIFYTDEREGSTVGPGQRSWREYRAKFSAGQLQGIERVQSEDNACPIYYGLASFRWFHAPSFLFGDRGEE